MQLVAVNEAEKSCVDINIEGYSDDHNDVQTGNCELRLMRCVSEAKLAVIVERIQHYREMQYVCDLLQAEQCNTIAQAEECHRLHTKIACMKCEAKINGALSEIVDSEIMANSELNERIEYDAEIQKDLREELQLFEEDRNSSSNSSSFSCLEQEFRGALQRNEANQRDFAEQLLRRDDELMCRDKCIESLEVKHEETMRDHQADRAALDFHQKKLLKKEALELELRDELQKQKYRNDALDTICSDLSSQLQIIQLQSKQRDEKITTCSSCVSLSTARDAAQQAADNTQLQMLDQQKVEKDLKFSLENASTKVIELQAQIEHLKDDAKTLSAAQEHGIILTESLATIQQDLDTERSIRLEMERKSEHIISQLKHDLSQFATVDAEKRELAELVQAMKTKLHEVDEIGAERDAAMTTLDDMKSHLETLQRSRDDALHLFAEQKKLCIDTETRIDTLTREKFAIETRCVQANNFFYTLQQKSDELQQQLCTRNTEFEELKTRLEDTENTRKKLHNELSNIKELAEQRSEKIISLQDSLTSVSDESKKKLELLKNKNFNLQKQKETLENVNENIMKENMDVKCSTQVQHVENCQTIAALQEQLFNVQSRLTQAERVKFKLQISNTPMVDEDQSSSSSSSLSSAPVKKLCTMCSKMSKQLSVAKKELKQQRKETKKYFFMFEQQQQTLEMNSKENLNAQ